MNNIHNAIGYIPKEDYRYRKKKLAHISLKLRYADSSTVNSMYNYSITGFTASLVSFLLVSFWHSLFFFVLKCNDKGIAHVH